MTKKLERQLIPMKCSIDGCNKEGVLQATNQYGKVIAFFCKFHSRPLKTVRGNGN